MHIIAADDEKLALDMLCKTLHTVLPEAEIAAFGKPSQVLMYVQENHCDVAFLDIQMHGMTGLELARRLKELQPQINIIFVTGFSEYIGEAMYMHASGYIEKPVTEAAVRHELEDLRHPVEPERKDTALLRVHCFGTFDVYAPDGERVHFEREKSRECFAYLISRIGNSCSVREIAGILFEDAPYDRRKANYVQQIITGMMKSLKRANAAGVIRKSYNAISVEPKLIDCDYYRFRSGDAAAVNSYTGEFMTQYPWAEFITGSLRTKI